MERQGGRCILVALATWGALGWGVGLEAVDEAYASGYADGIAAADGAGASSAVSHEAQAIGMDWLTQKRSPMPSYVTAATAWASRMDMRRTLPPGTAG